MKHSNISIFVPHIGCPNMCAFCNQRHITGQTQIPRAVDVANAVSIAKNSPRYSPEMAEIAFFGGSFTAINREYMLELLCAAYQEIKLGNASGIRISTRPDAIDEEILHILKDYGVTSIELGAQSMVDTVLRANDRGHTAEDVARASKLIKDFDFELGLQMMTGLYTTTPEDDIYTADQIISLSPQTVRIYPTITIKGTRLEELYLSGEYSPQTLDEAVCLCASLKEKFISNGIKVIRLGLHSIDNAAYVAGPWHPAFSELCDSIRFRNKLEVKISDAGQYEVLVNPRDISKVKGQACSNIKYFSLMGITLKIIPDENIKQDSFTIKEVK